MCNYVSNRTFFVVYGAYYSAPRPITAGVPQGSVLGPLLYALYTADLPEPEDAIIATFADDTAILASSPHYPEAVQQLQSALDQFYTWTRRWKILLSSEKSTNITFALRPHPYHPVTLASEVLPYRTTAKYLGVHLDVRLTYSHHIHTKRTELDLRLRKLLWLLRGRSPLSLANRRLLYMTVLRPVWTYAIAIWGCASTSLRNIIQRFQNKTLRTIAGAPWFVRNDTIHQDLRVPTVVEVIRFLATRHENRLHRHPNPLALNLLNNSEEIRRLRRRHCADLVSLE